MNTVVTLRAKRCLARRRSGTVAALHVRCINASMVGVERAALAPYNDDPSPESTTGAAYYLLYYVHIMKPMK